jgi:hypothetical protein
MDIDEGQQEIVNAYQRNVKPMTSLKSRLDSYCRGCTLDFQCISSALSRFGRCPRLRDSQCPFNPMHQSFLAFVRKRMFPHSKDNPTLRTQYAVHKLVSLLICFKFPYPELPVAFWNRQMLRATMPEAAVHKNRNLQFRENEVWSAKDRLLPPPSSDGCSAENASHRQLGIFVTPRPNM